MHLQECHVSSKTPVNRVSRPAAACITAAHCGRRRRGASVCAPGFTALVACASGLLPWTVRAQDPLYDGRVLAPSGAIGTERGITLEVTRAHSSQDNRLLLSNMVHGK